ncbi:ABC transporter ATP-binding protein [Amycolatopsis sp. 195334CR]|uniref:ABC transporter ATP-binding protein n=1 Tax=Amycolatopsis sp. 195334CR TaxID=2814588 RepID=UPI001A9006F9|nr:ABC transporter ATP-binding protein [Amycolatopsis sp. 195334CR]MBN6036590.1 ABC transporter ATP-binding protein [Amycolatopsis sp. 195334CR]
MTAVELRGITKRFPGVLANDGVDLSVDRGEIHALVGENGAGKTTLMSILYGTQRPDEGSVELLGEPARGHGPADRIAAGIGMVHQHFMLFGGLTVTENVVYNRGVLARKARAEVAGLIERYGLGLDPDARVRDLPIGVRQRVEILKLLYRDSRILILDEPTAVLTPAEADRLFEVLRELAAEGRSVILVTHKLREVLAISSRVTVLRDGRRVAGLRTADTTAADLARAMTGRDIELDVIQPPGTPGDVVLDVRGLTVAGGTKPLVDNASVTVRAGEILGVAGVAGNGQSEFAEALAGLRAFTGSVSLLGKPLTRAAVAYLPEDRGEVGSAQTASLAENLVVGYHRSGLLSPAKMRAHAQKIVSRFNVKAASVTAPIGVLSGGNQQKALLGRELTRDAPLLIAEQPTRGVDIGSVRDIHAELVAHRDAGHAIVVVSAELSEIRGLADRVIVFFDGRIVASLSREEATEERLGLAMAGEPS